MAFEKMIPSEIQEYKIFNVSSTEELIKEASDVDFPEGFIYDPDFLYMWVRIVSAGQYWGPNKNGDYFPEGELRDYWDTFNEAHPFKNHKNKNVEDAIGEIISVRWNPMMKGVELLKGIDKKRAPEVARGYVKGYLTDVSMGCKVPYTICSICGNKARKQSEFCDHVKYHRLQFLGNGERVYEINYSPKFHDSSTVLNGAERVAKAFYIIDAPPPGVAVSAFKKTASTDKTTHFVRLTQYEMDKVASAQKETHPLLHEETQEKLAGFESPMMRKIAEIEKQLTGKLLNVVSTPKSSKLPAMKQMLEVIKFLTEKRMDENSLKNIAHTVKNVAKANGVPVSRAFATLIGMAELMGIELFPTELHTILRGLTDADLNEELAISSSSDLPVYPSELAKGIGHAVITVQKAKDFADPSALMDLYNESAHNTEDFANDPLSFLSGIHDGSEMDTSPPSRVIKVIHQTLSPIASIRSSAPDVLLPKLSVILGGHRPMVGGAAVRKDLDMLMNPISPGDLLGRLAYHIYENMRPRLKRTRLIKLAEETKVGLEKTAAIGRGKLALTAIPAAYAASAFQKSRRDNGRYLTDGQNFVADHPGIVAGGVVLGGKPLLNAVGTAANKGKQIAGDAADLFKQNFVKMADYRSFEGLVKVADSLSSGNFNVFGDLEVSKRYMNETGANSEETSAVKMATILSAGGMDKEAYELMDFYHIPTHEKGRFLKIAADYLDEEMEKAAEDFTNNMILSAIGDTSPLGRTLPGRAVDAFVFKQLGKLVQPKQQPNGEVQQPPVNGGKQ